MVVVDQVTKFLALLHVDGGPEVLDLDQSLPDENSLGDIRNTGDTE
jgi:hypothetical protein